MCLCIRFHCRKLVSVFFDYLFNGKKMFFVFRIEGNIIKADTTYISRVANCFPAIFAWRIIYTHHMIDAVAAVDNHSIYLNWFHWSFLLL